MMGAPAVPDTRSMTTIHAAASASPLVAEPTIAGHRLPMLDRARIYACGITPYDVTHLGHAATFVWIDMLSRVLRFLGIEPEICRNITDVDDVLDAAALRAGAPYDAFAAIQQFHFERDMAALGVRSPQHEPRAHRYVEHVIRLAAGLLSAGTAYQRRGSVYFRGRPPSAPLAWTGPRACGCPRNTAAARMIRARTTRSTWRCGRPASRITRHGNRPGERAGRDGTQSAPPWRYPCSGSAWTFTRAGRIFASRITPTTRRWRSHLPACGRMRADGCTPAP